ncbi:hypothetical protein AUI46_03395 [archaeon 13_1_40CM_2_52_13]|nr:MAG: hypothetical protein AUI46_03395 [archaeon 13_1_40CM_2_52_13]OLE70004.1 MAG: hypothetical protein AUF78_08430 [archaeon 13_1_20CM_2_51_12]
MRVLVPFVRGWTVVVRAIRFADSTSVGLSYLSAIAQTRERNCYSHLGYGATHNYFLFKRECQPKFSY